jgi:hypothetical protein
MKLIELVDDVIINPRKLTHYSLNTDSPKGKFNYTICYTR